MTKILSEKIEQGSSIIDFSLPATDGQTYTPASFSDNKALVIVFTCNHCPYAQLAKPKLQYLHQRYHNQGIGFVAINPNDDEAYPEDNFDKMKEERFNYPFPYLRDESGEVAQSYGAVCTPDTFIYDQDQKLVYRGQIDDERPNSDSPLSDKDDSYSRDLKDALEAILAGHQPAPEQKPSVGCSIKWKS